MKAPVAVIYANLKGNIGDFAILHAMLADLQERHPGHPLHVYSHRFLSTDAARLAAFRASAPPFELIGTIHSQTLSRRYKRLGRTWLWALIRPVFVGFIQAASWRVGRRFASYAAIYVAGGDQWGGYKGISMLEVAAGIARRNPRIRAYPFSVNPDIVRLTGETDLRDYFGALGEPLVVRDSISRGVLQRIGLDPVLGADCVFGLEEAARAVPARADCDPARTIVALTGRSRRELEPALREMLRRVTPAIRNVALLTTCAIEDAETFRRLGAEFGVEVLEPETWQDAVAEFKASSLVVTNRLHGLILGSLAGAALLPVADRKKAEAFVADAAMPHHAASIADVSADLIGRAAADRSLVLERIGAYVERCRAVPRAPVAPGSA